MPVRQNAKPRQVSGGASHCEDGAADSPAATAVIDTRITALEAMTTADLRIEWRRLYRTTPPIRLSRDLLLRGVAYKVQEQAFGGLNLRTRRTLRSLSEHADQHGGSPAAHTVLLKPGTKLVREWHEHVHTVSVLDDGFEYRGERYSSLTHIAKRITGSHRSGPLFFGLKSRETIIAGRTRR
jgi:hypothetical protein